MHSTTCSGDKQLFVHVFHRSSYTHTFLCVSCCWLCFSRHPAAIQQPVHPHGGAEEGSAQASAAAGEVVDALIGCRFEETQQGHDEAVRARIMQVMVGCLEGGAGTWLPDEVVWEVLQTCMANLDQMVRGLRPGRSRVSVLVAKSRLGGLREAGCGRCGDGNEVLLHGVWV